MVNDPLRLSAHHWDLRCVCGHLYTSHVGGRCTLGSACGCAGFRRFNGVRLATLPPLDLCRKTD